MGRLTERCPGGDGGSRGTSAPAVGLRRPTDMMPMHLTAPSPLSRLLSDESGKKWLQLMDFGRGLVNDSLRAGDHVL
jgi:hypothetical protein